MNHPIEIKAFKLKGSNYIASEGLIFRKRITLEDYIVHQLNRGYIIADFRNYGPKTLFLSFVYEPERAQEVIKNEGKSPSSTLSRIKKDEMDKV